jgi:hypothetical protein
MLMFVLWRGIPAKRPHIRGATEVQTDASSPSKHGSSSIELDPNRHNGRQRGYVHLARTA